MSRARGFSVLEVFVAMLIVAAAVLALAALLPLSLQATRRSQTDIVAHNLGRQYLEWWRQQTFDVLKIAAATAPTVYVDPMPYPTPLPPSPQQYGSLVGNAAGATYRTTVTLTPQADPNLMQIDVVVDWQAGGPVGDIDGATGESEIHYISQVFNTDNPMVTWRQVSLGVLLLLCPARADTFHLRTEPGDVQVIRVGTSTLVGTTTEGDTGEAAIDLDGVDSDHYLLVRSPFDPLEVDVQKDPQSGHWEWSSDSHHGDVDAPAVFALRRNVRLAVEPSGWTAWYRPSDAGAGDWSGPTLVIDGIPRAVLPLAQSGDEVVVPRAWRPPPLYLQRPGFDIQELQIPAGALSQGDVYPPQPLQLHPRYGPFSYGTFDGGLAVLLAGGVGTALWWTRRRRRLAVQRGSGTEKALPSSEFDLAGEVVTGDEGHQYLLNRRLGEGGAAVVFQATCLDTSEAVAVKVIRQQAEAVAQARLQREINICASLQHPSIVKVIDWGEIVLAEGKKRSFIVMELVVGETLRDYLGRTLPSVEQAVAWLIEILVGLREAHRNGIVHRDMKPENLMVTPSGHLKIMDFGIARDESHNITESQVAMGTPRYMAPEHINARMTTAESDIYSVGLIGYEMLTGRLPFEEYSDDTAWAVVLRRLNSNPIDIRTFNSTLPPALSDTIMAMLARVPAQRRGALDRLKSASPGMKAKSPPG